MFFIAQDTYIVTTWFSCLNLAWMIFIDSFKQFISVFGGLQMIPICICSNDKFRIISLIHMSYIYISLVMYENASSIWLLQYDNNNMIINFIIEIDIWINFLYMHIKINWINFKWLKKSIWWLYWYRLKVIIILFIYIKWIKQFSFM